MLHGDEGKPDEAATHDVPTHRAASGSGPRELGACERGPDHRIVAVKGARTVGVVLRAELLAELCEAASRVAVLAEGSAAQAAAHDVAERLNALLHTYLDEQAAHTAPVPFAYRPPRRPRG
jgi:hypothetical protein